MNYWGLIKKTLENWRNRTSRKRRQRILEKYWQYENITLKLYLEIAGSGEVVKLCKQGVADNEASEVWESIVRKNQEASGSLKYDNYFTSMQDYAMMVNEYIFIKSALLELSIAPNKDLIEELRNRGIKLNTSGSDKFLESIGAALKKSENLVTKIVSKKKEIDSKQEERSNNESSFEEIMASLVSGLGFSVGDDLTLARFNEYRKIIKKKNEKKPRNGRN